MRTLLILTVLTLAAGSAFAQNDVPVQKLEGDPAITTLEDGQLSGTQDAIQIANRKALNEELRSSRQAAQIEVASLTEELETAVTSEDRMAIQKRISDVKQKAWRDNLAIQLKFAELGGFSKQAEELQERIVRLDEGISKPQATQPGTPRTPASSEGGAR